jgi:hypothetical protein
MRKIIVSSILLLFSLYLSNSLKAQTTEAEYNYVTTGYKIQVIDQGGDLKKGYSLQPVNKRYGIIVGNDGLREVKMLALYRSGEQKPCAYMMIYKREQTNFEKYYCIPSTNSKSELWTKTQNAIIEDLKSASPAYSLTLIMALMKFVSDQEIKS